MARLAVTFGVWVSLHLHLTLQRLTHCSLDSVTRSPLYSIYGEAIAGVAVIRAFGASTKFLREMLRRVDTNSSPWVYFSYFMCVINSPLLYQVSRNVERITLGLMWDIIPSLCALLISACPVRLNMVSACVVAISAISKWRIAFFQVHLLMNWPLRHHVRQKHTSRIRWVGSLIMIELLRETYKINIRFAMSLAVGITFDFIILVRRFV